MAVLLGSFGLARTTGKSQINLFSNTQRALWAFYRIKTPLEGDQGKPFEIIVVLMYVRAGICQVIPPLVQDVT